MVEASPEIRGACRFSIDPCDTVRSGTARATTSDRSGAQRAMSRQAPGMDADHVDTVPSVSTRGKNFALINASPTFPALALACFMASSQSSTRSPWNGAENEVTLRVYWP
ncbi:hypothetical protein G6F32_016547 [Rhizopus arrhizus]|nr:hypothetical protein G6F32_016547 [Rhizopus arrhizus]